MYVCMDVNTYLMKLKASDGLNKDRIGRNSK